MKKLVPFVLLLATVSLTGCSSDDDDTIIPPPTSLSRVVSFHASSAPSLTDVDHNLWANAAAMTVDVMATPLASEAPGRAEPQTATVISAQISVKAITCNDTLYVRFTWDDATFDIWRDRYAVIDTIETTVQFTRDTIASKEDQLLVMFAGLPESGWDSWHWRLLRTCVKQNPGGQFEGFAEGKTLRNGTLTTDEGNLAVAYENLRNPPSNQPPKMHRDSSEFNGFILYFDESVDLDETTRGWSIGQFIPGWRIDSTVAGATKDLTRLSRWDTRAVADWDDGADQYSLVLCRALDTGYEDDLAMADSVKARIGISNNVDFVFNQGSTKQGFTPEFWVIF